MRFFTLLLGACAFVNVLWGEVLEASEEFSKIPKLEGSLAQLLDLDHAQALLWAGQQGIDLDATGRFVRVIIESKNFSLDIKSLGGVLEARSESLLKARVPLARLKELSQLSGVSFIRRPYRFQLLSHFPYTTHFRTGTLPTGATLFHSYGFRGQGIKIAIIDAGFRGLSQAVRKGWIAPSSIYEKIDYSGQGLETGSDHGTQVARIVHEMAPDAQLVLMNIGSEGTEVELENAALDAIRLGVQIVNHSIGWFDSNFGDGTGLINEVVHRAFEAGILWVNAAGNQAQRHWTGLFQDRDGDGWAEFGYELEELTIWAGFGGTLSLVLLWDDWPRTTQDFDLFLFDEQNELVASSEGSSRAFDPPREWLEYAALKPGVYKLRVKVQRVTRPLRLKIFSLEHDLAPATPHGSIIAPADCVCALAVGAIGLHRWEEGIVESFSARGPTSDGRIKPDLVAPDRVRDFPGTSAAAPHVAGAAALWLSRHPEWDVAQLWKTLERDAIDLGLSGRDVESGAGKLHLLLSRPQALRSFSMPKLTVGGEVVIRISVRMPAALFGSLTLRERPPAGFILEPMEHGRAHFSREEGTNEAGWILPPLGPGSTFEIVYRLRISEGVRPGVYQLEGDLDGQPVEGNKQLEVLPASGAPVDLGIATRVASREIAFRLEGLPGPMRWQIRIFALSGQKRFDSGRVSQNHLTIRVRDWANGIYLYVVTIYDPDDQPLHSEIRKLVWLRGW